MSRRVMGVFVSCLFVCSMAVGAVTRQELMPKDCSMVIRVSNTTKFVDAFEKSSLGKLWADPQMQPVFHNKSFSQMMKDSWTKQEGDELGHLIWEEMMMVKGELIVGFREEMKKPVIIAYMEKEDFLRSLEMDARIAELKENSKRSMVKETFQGVPMIKMIEEKVNDQGEEETEITWQAHVNDTLITAYDRPLVERAVVAAKKSGVKEPEEGATLDFQMNVATFVDALENSVPPPPPPPPPDPNGRPMPPMPQPPRPKQVFDALGLMQVDKVVVKLTMKESEMVLDSHVYGSNFSQGIFRILDMQPTSLDMTLPFVPANAFSYEVARIDLRALWLELPKMMSAISPEMGMQVQFMIGGLVSQLGIDLDKDLLAHLDTEYVAFGATAENKPSAITCIRLANEMAVKDAVSKIFSETSNLRISMGEGLDIEEFRGAPLYVFPPKQIPVMPPPGGDPSEMTIKDGPRSALGIAGGFLVWGEEAGVRGVLRAADVKNKQPSAFYSSKLIKELKRLAPSSTRGYSVIDIGAYINAFLSDANDNSPLEMIKMMSGRAAMMGGNADNGPMESPDLSKLPPAGHIAKFFGPVFTYQTKDAKGLHGKAIFRYAPLAK